MALFTGLIMILQATPPSGLLNLFYSPEGGPDDLQRFAAAADEEVRGKIIHIFHTLGAVAPEVPDIQGQQGKEKEREGSGTHKGEFLQLPGFETQAADPEQVDQPQSQGQERKGRGPQPAGPVRQVHVAPVRQSLPQLAPEEQKGILTRVKTPF